MTSWPIRPTRRSGARGNDRFEPQAAGSKPPDEVSFVARRPGAVARVRFRCVPDGELATEVSCELELELNGGTRLVAPLIAEVMRRGLETSRGPALKQALEALPPATSG
jgi:hypothetical protein